MKKEINENKIYTETIDELLKRKKKDTRIKIILAIIIVILLLLFWWLGFKMGKIGFGTQNVTGDINEPDKEIVDAIRVMTDDIEITKNTELAIFKNEQFEIDNMIAPKSNGSYRFYVSNEADDNIKYDINFLDEMKHFVNMKYRLKLDNIYIRGNEDTYVTIDELSVDDITVLKDSNNIFTLEWLWEDSDAEDTFVASQEERQYYTLKLQINAERLDIKK